MFVFPLLIIKSCSATYGTAENVINFFAVGDYDLINEYIVTYACTILCFANIHKAEDIEAEYIIIWRVILRNKQSS